jgi:hypothetical protein
VIVIDLSWFKFESESFFVVRLENHVYLSYSVQVTGVICRTVTRIMLGLENLV